MARIVLALVSSCLLFEAALAGPRIRPRFTVTISRPEGWHSANKGKFSYDTVSQRYHLDFKNQTDWFYDKSYVTKDDYWGDSQRSYYLSNGQCITDPSVDGPVIVARGGFKAFFGWSKTAVPAGTDVWQNRTCKKWHDAATNGTLCMDRGIPVYMDVFYVFAAFKNMMRFSFGNDAVMSVDPKALPPPEVCTGPPVTCGSDAVELMQIYIFHPRDHFNISGQDVADVRGDADYICSDDLWKVEDYEVASLYEIHVLQTFGQYANCNFYNPSSCFGGDNFHVGREAPRGYGIHSGQCEEDSDLWDNLGIWYSLPQGGLCTDSSQEIGRDCSWRVQRRVKTFNISCLFDSAHDLQTICKSDGPPFINATTALVKAYAYEDAQRGGCPAIKVDSEISYETRHSDIIV